MIRLPAEITEDHRLIVELPTDLPPGKVEIVIHRQSDEVNSERESVRAALAAAGLLSSTDYIPDDLTIDDDLPVTLPPGVRGSEELINEDREER